MNATTNLLYVGDNAQDKQYKSILSFDTSSLPDNAEIKNIQLKFKVQGFIGGNPFIPTKKLGNLLVDISQFYFGTGPELEVIDFESVSSMDKVGVLKSMPNAGWYTITLKDTAYPFISLDGTTQLRLRFKKDDNDDTGADYLKIFSGDAGENKCPQLIIEYYVP